MFRGGFTPTPPGQRSALGDPNLAGDGVPTRKKRESVSTLSMPPQFSQNCIRVLPYKNYFQEVLCFTTGSNPSAQDVIRGQIHALCGHENIKVYSDAIQMPQSDIPQMPWTLAFAPSIFVSGAWAIVFAVPMDSEFVWFFWPSKNESEDKITEYLRQARKEGKIKPEETMAIGSTRHMQFHAMIEQAVWQFHNRDLLGQDWGSGEH